jgi:hypothetical protein
MTSAELISSEIRLLDVQRQQDIPYTANVFAWQQARAAELLALEADLGEMEAEGNAAR